jgi:YD repeat-containing protein
MISTAWQGIWRLPIIVAEPKKLTMYAYNGDVDPATGVVVNCAPSSATVPTLSGDMVPISALCKRTEQATTDGNGGAGFSAGPTGNPRTWSYTYNQYGQILSADGPRTDVADVTSYGYYPLDDPDLGKRGNLATVTDALGQTTQYLAYDLNGRPLSIVAPDGVVTTLSYDLRGRLTSRSVSDETTSYSYDGVGQLVGIVMPDGAAISYSYDAAHRLVAIADSAGDRIEYTLDTAGNRIREDIRDPQGALVKTLGRAYDALGRLQTLTGVGHE